MGFNTAVVLLNDTMSEIEHDTEFGQKLALHCRHIRWPRAGLDSGPHGVKALPPQSADRLQIVGIGGNTIRMLGYADLEADDLAVAKAMALKLGYRLTKIHSRKGL